MKICICINLFYNGHYDPIVFSVLHLIGAVTVAGMPVGICIDIVNELHVVSCQELFDPGWIEAKVPEFLLKTQVRGRNNIAQEGLGMGQYIFIDVGKDDPCTAGEFTEIPEDLVSDGNGERIGDPFPDDQRAIMRFQQVVGNGGFQFLVAEIYGDIVDELSWFIFQIFQHYSFFFL